jgi:hypothetical protein
VEPLLVSYLAIDPSLFEPVMPACRPFARSAGSSALTTPLTARLRALRLRSTLLGGSMAALGALPLLGGLIVPVGAQQAQPAKAAPKPATVDEVNTYMTMAAINMCTLAQLKVPFKTAMEGNISMVSSVLTNKHGGRVVGSAEALNQKQLINATVAETSLRVESFCGKNLSADWKKELDPIVAQVKSAFKAGGAKTK